MPISVLVVGGGGGLPRRLRLARPGLRTSALCSSVTLPRMKAPGEHQAVLALGDEATTDDWISAARYLDTAGRFDALACFGERDQDRAASVADALGVTFGPTHTELVVTEAGPRVLETHTRLAGDDIPLLVQDATGVDLEQLTIDQVGRYSSPNPEPAKPREREPSAIWFLGCRVDGTVVSVTGLDLCRASNGVHEASVSVCPGDLVRRLGASQDRIGMVRARGATAEDALDNARRAAGLIEIAVDARLDTDLAIV